MRTIALAFLFIAIATPTQAFDNALVFIPVKEDCYADVSYNPVVFPVSRACNPNTGEWIASSSGSKITFNLTNPKSFITGIYVKCGNLLDGLWGSPAEIQTSADNWASMRRQYIETTNFYRCNVPSIYLNFTGVFASAIRLIYKPSRHGEISGFSATGPRNDAPSDVSSNPTLLILFFLGMLWLGFFIAGTGLKTGFFVILSGVSALLFAITAWTTTNDIPSSILLFAAAAFTLIWSVRVIMEERSATG